MRPLFHPPIDTITVEGIMHALSDPVRVGIYTKIVGEGAPQGCSALLGTGTCGKPLPKSTLSQHLKVLREAGLVRGERRGKEMHNTSRCGEIETEFPGLIRSIVNAHLIQNRRKAKMSKPQPKRKAASARA